MDDLPDLDLIDGDFTESLNERLELATWDSERCWRELETFAFEHKDDVYADRGFASHLIEIISKKKTDFEQRVLDHLNKEIDYAGGDPLEWMEIFAVELAGLMRLEPAIPRLMQRIDEDVSEALNEVCAPALVNIGTDTVVKAVADWFPETSWQFKLYTVSVFEKVHSELAMSRAAALFKAEKDNDIKSNLGEAIVLNFAEKHFDLVHQFIRNSPMDSNLRGLRKDFVNASILVGYEYPEKHNWTNKVRKEEAHSDEMSRRFETGEDLHHYVDPDEENVFKSMYPTDLMMENLPEPDPAPTSTKKQKIGRNDPCPCQSGKKYKNCCLRKHTL